jgi:hypothetical protein
VWKKGIETECSRNATRNLTADRTRRNGSEEQLRILNSLNAHLKLERIEGREIWPAEQARINDSVCDVATQREYTISVRC